MKNDWVSSVKKLKEQLAKKFEGQIMIDESFLEVGVIVGTYKGKGFSIIYDENRFVEFTSVEDVKKQGFEIQTFLSKKMKEGPYCVYKIVNNDLGVEDGNLNYVYEWCEKDKRDQRAAAILKGTAFPEGAIISDLVINDNDFDEESGKIKLRTYYPLNHFKKQETIEK